ncbi:RagB/SusD family nutrient uptake outer membrane protein [termite gut metagenome]|uniref:RagB/SusD family nutrient uptake outer membrane protein n=1 Tax=termite gut metagenome TaxID=433724 RepID=A0A5J4SHC6_9ZZZZ
MKKIYYVVMVVLASFVVFSCTDADSLLDKEDVGVLYEKDVFTNPTYAAYFVNDIYYKMPGSGYQPASGFGGAYLDCATDNGEARPLTSDAHDFNNGNWNAITQPLSGAWNTDYAEIRACNKFLKYYPYIQEIQGIATRERLEYLKAQVVCLRAMYYADLLRNYGGIPIVTYVIDDKYDPILTAPRNTFEECVEFIVSQCDTVSILFGSINVSSVEKDSYGRVNADVALALKAKVLTMVASPLFNRPPNYPQYDSNDPNLRYWRYPDYKIERWERAAKACKTVIDLNKYDVYRQKTGAKSAYETYFVTRHTPEETILPFLRGPSNEIYFNNLPFEFMLVSGRGVPVCYNLPTQDLVEAYEMKNGMLPDQPNSGYRPLYPFSNRDPRLEATIWHDESVFYGVQFQTWRRDVTSDKIGGKHYITGYSRTGFFLRKYMDIDQNPSASGASLPNCYPVIRYADILLCYAEALNEYYDSPGAVPEDQVRWAIDKVRSRAEMPSVDVTFANRGWAFTQENIRKLIRNERRVEFAFEEYRFWDIRRWMIGTETQKEAHELDIVLEDDDKTKRYTVKPIEKRVYEDKMNLMPIPQNEINRNANLVQNWGWSPVAIN